MYRQTIDVEYPSRWQ